MSSVVLKVGKVLTPTQELEKAAIFIEGDMIKEVVSWEKIPRNKDVLNYTDSIAAPGFIDIHTHGYGGHDATSGEEKDLIDFAESILRHGVTSFLPTTVTASQDVLLERSAMLRNAMEKNEKGAEILGLHLEGPCVGKGREAGVQNIEFARNPNVSELEELVKASKGNIRRVTLAPELPGALEYIRRAKELGLVVAAGHTNATFEEAIAGFDAGITICNHLFNGMRPFHHREPGIIGACLVRKDVYAEIIADMIHLHPVAISVAIKAKGPKKIILITDAAPQTGLPDGEYELGGIETIVKDGISRIKATGRLASSTLTMNNAIKNMVTKLNLNLKNAIRMATLNPADALNLSDRGRLVPGCVANVTVLDSKFKVLATIVKGKMLYEAI
ncbi:MAG: N-acetylglucosamine-6-phosphate deacetylase [Candidatus Hadarchaeaceae archaeon]